MKPTLTLLLLTLLGGSIQAQQWTTVQTHGAAGTEGANTIRVDQDGHTVITGSCSAPITIDGTTLPQAGCFVARSRPDGSLHWMRPAGMNLSVTVVNRRTSASLETSGAFIYVTGNLGTSSMVGDSTLTGSGAQNGFVAALDTTGVLIWVTVMQGSALCNDIALDPDGNLLIAGTLEEPTDFGGAVLTPFGGANSGGDAFVAKYDASGNLLWARHAGGTGFYSDRAFCVTSDPDGNVIFGGMIRSHADFGGLSLLSTAFMQSYFNGFLAKYDGNGTALWVKYAGYDATCLGTDALGTIYVGGNTGPDNGFDDLQAPTDDRMYLARAEPDGSYSWVRSVVGLFNSGTMDLVVDATGITASGYYVGEAAFGPFVLPGNNPSTIWYPHLFVARTTHEGDWLWATHAGGATGSLTWGCGIDQVDGCDFRVAGAFSTPPEVTFDQPLTSAGGHDLFMATLNGCMTTDLVVEDDLVLASAAPNPAHDRTVITWPSGSLPRQLTLVNAQGLVCRTVPIHSQRDLAIDLTGLAAGAYVLQSLEHPAIPPIRLIKE